MGKGKLTSKQAAFVDEYLIDLNATQAYYRAGYRAKNDEIAASNAVRLKGNEKVSRAIEKALADRSVRTQITADYVIQNLQEVAARCMQKTPVMYFDKVDRCMKQATEVVIDAATGEKKELGVWTFDSTGANRSLELMGKHLGMFVDRKEIKHDFTEVSDEELRAIVLGDEDGVNGTTARSGD